MDASIRFGHLRTPQIGVLRNPVSVHGNSESPLFTRESADWLESGRRESNPRSQLGKLTSLTSEVAESPVPTWKYSFGLQTQCWFGRSMGGPWALDQDASGSRWAMP